MVYVLQKLHAEPIRLMFLRTAKVFDCKEKGFFSFFQVDGGF
jgi:hypothetical protein